MKFSHLDIKPILVYLPDTEQWLARWEKGKQHFADSGLTDIYSLPGVHGEKWGILTNRIYLLDGRPEEKHNIGPGKVAGKISQYIAWVVMDALPYSHYLYLEDDCRFVPDWKAKVDQAILDVPHDFDFLFVGSCCAASCGTHHKGNVYAYSGRYPMCGHAVIVAKKCVQFLIANNRDASIPADISLLYSSFPSLKIYAILPRLAEQENTTLEP